MKIETTNGTVFQAAQAVARLASCKMPGTVAIKVMRLARVLGPEAEALEGARKAVLDRYVLRDDDGKEVPERDAQNRVMPGRVLLKDKAAYWSEVDKIMNDASELDVTPLRLSDVESIADVEPEVLIGLGPFFVDSSK